MAETFEAMIERERERLKNEREDALARRKQIDDEIEAIDQEFEAIEAYERVKTRKTQKRTVSHEPSQRARRGERQQEILDLIGQNSEGLTRGEILEQLGVKGDKKAEASVSNALNNLKKGGRLGSRGKSYILPE